MIFVIFRSYKLQRVKANDSQPQPTHSQPTASDHELSALIRCLFTESPREQRVPPPTALLITPLIYQVVDEYRVVV